MEKELLEDASSSTNATVASEWLATVLDLLGRQGVVER